VGYQSKAVAAGPENSMTMFLLAVNSTGVSTSRGTDLQCRSKGGRGKSSQSTKHSPQATDFLGNLGGNREDASSHHWISILIEI